MTLPRPPSAVVFDMDGLLFDSEVFYTDAIVGAMERNGYHLPLSLFRQTIGMSGDATRVFFRNHFGEGLDFDGIWSEASAEFHEVTANGVPLKSGAIELLDHLHSLSLPRAIATSSRHADVNRHLSAHALADRFQAIVAQGDYARGKPHPDPYLVAADRLNTPPEQCLALEDSHNGVRAAAKAGMMTIMIPDLLDATAEMEDLCVAIFQDLHAVRKLMRLPSGK